MFRTIKNILLLINGFFAVLSNLLKMTSLGIDCLNKEMERVNKDFERKRLMNEREKILGDASQISISAKRLNDD